MAQPQHVVEPIRPGGGLRRLRQGDISRSAESTSTLLSRAQFRSTLQAEIDRALQDELTMLVMRVRMRPLPDRGDGGLSGNQIPAELLERIRNCNEHLRVATISGSELMAMVPSLRRRPDGEQLVAHLLDVLTPPLSIDGLPHHLSPLIGAAMLDHESPSADLLIDGARLALDECDTTHPGMMFHPYQRVRHDRRKEMELDLRAAIRDGQITAALQPAFELGTGRMVAFEAFARWDRAGKGPVPAVEFVQMATEMGVGQILDRHVLEQGLTMLNQLGTAGALLDPPTMWVNVSPEEVLHPEFASTITSAVKASSHVRVGMELSPSPPADARDIHQILKTLVARGARVAIGDFGIGNANLTMLQQLPFDAVKLDRALIRQIAGNDAAADLVKALIEMASLLELETTAQGIENQAQLDVLSGLGCRIGQGFHFAEPTSDRDTIASWFHG